jgi:hypothetical protein
VADEQFSNNARTTLSGAISNSATTIAVAAATGFPSAAQFRILIDAEILLVTGGAGTTSWTVTRGAEGTTADPHGDGALVTHILTAASLKNLPDYARTDTLTAKGDLYVATGAGVVARLAVGTDGQVLTADAAVSAGVKWAAVGGGQGDVSLDLATELMNFPSLERADDTQPEWWEEQDANAALTEVDLAGEGITEIAERALKLGVSTAASHAYQRLTYGDQPRVKAGRTARISFLVWCVGGVTARLRLQSSSGSLGVSADATAAAWTRLAVSAVTLDGIYLDVRLELAGAGTAYFIPCDDVGAVLRQPRGVRFQWRDPVELVNQDGAGDPATWTAVDCTPHASPLAAIALTHWMAASNVSDYKAYLRRKGSSQAATANSGASIINAGPSYVAGVVVTPIVLDDQQVFEYQLDRVGGANAIQTFRINLLGWWEWA